MPDDASRQDHKQRTEMGAWIDATPVDSESAEPHDDATSVIARFGKPSSLAEGIRPKPTADCSQTR